MPRFFEQWRWLLIRLCRHEVENWPAHNPIRDRIGPTVVASGSKKRRLSAWVHHLRVDSLDRFASVIGGVPTFAGAVLSAQEADLSTFDESKAVIKQCQGGDFTV